jgi:hypothetical protein
MYNINIAAEMFILWISTGNVYNINTATGEVYNIRIATRRYKDIYRTSL